MSGHRLLSLAYLIDRHTFIETGTPTTVWSMEDWLLPSRLRLSRLISGDYVEAMWEASVSTKDGMCTSIGDADYDELSRYDDELIETFSVKYGGTPFGNSSLQEVLLTLPEWDHLALLMATTKWPLSEAILRGEGLSDEDIGKYRDCFFVEPSR